MIVKKTSIFPASKETVFQKLQQLETSDFKKEKTSFTIGRSSCFLTIFLAVVFCAAITMLLISAVAFVQYDGTNKWFFSSAPKEALELLKPRNKELFYGAKAMGWALMIISILMILGVGVISVWDGFRTMPLR